MTEKKVRNVFDLPINLPPGGDWDSNPELFRKRK